MESSVLRRGRPTAEESRRKMADVLTAARQLFAEQGYRAVTMRDVAECAQVSTRTLYNLYEDKLRLFAACLESGASAFPTIGRRAGTPEMVLADYAAAIVRMLSFDSTMRLGLLMYREGEDFPELVRAAEANQHRYMVSPLADWLAANALGGDDSTARAKLFISMAISEWQRAVSFLRPLPTAPDIDHHAQMVARLFLSGARP